MEVYNEIPSLQLLPFYICGGYLFGAATEPAVTDMRMTIPAISILRITIMATDGSATRPNRDFFLPLMSQTEISNIRDMSELPRDQSVKDNPDNCKELRI